MELAFRTGGPAPYALFGPTSRGDIGTGLTLFPGPNGTGVLSLRVTQNGGGENEAGSVYRPGDLGQPGLHATEIRLLLGIDTGANNMVRVYRDIDGSGTYTLVASTTAFGNVSIGVGSESSWFPPENIFRGKPPPAGISIEAMRLWLAPMFNAGQPPLSAVTYGLEAKAGALVARQAYLRP